MTESRGRLAWRLAAAVLVLVQLPVLLRTGADPGQSDFANYFTPASVLARGGDIGTLYDRDTFAAALTASGLSGLGSFVPHPPPNALWLRPLVSLPPAAAKAVWTVLLVLSLALTAGAVARFGGGIPWEIAVVIVLAPTLAVRNALAFGQPYPLLAALLALGALALEGKREVLAGFLLGLGVSFKPYALPVGFVLVHRERRRALGGFVCGAMLPVALVCVLAGAATAFNEFGSKVFPWMVRGDIQDPFSPVWGSATALANRLFRLEPDLNPHPWVDWPAVARGLGSALPTTLIAFGVLASRRAMSAGRVVDAIGISVAFALAASPLAASYHLVLMAVPVAALVTRREGKGAAAVVCAWALVGSEVMTLLRAAPGVFAPLAFRRFALLALFGLALSWPHLGRRLLPKALAVGMLAAVSAASSQGRTETWSRVESARGYSMMKPYFCGDALRWMAPSSDGRRLEARGSGEDCGYAGSPDRSRDAPVVSRFTDGSWNLFLELGPTRERRTQLTFSSANEIDPVLTPDGCGVVFASDQGRGLGSTALYRLSLSGLRDGCAGPAPVGGPR